MAAFVLVTTILLMAEDEVVALHAQLKKEEGGGLFGLGRGGDFGVWCVCVCPDGLLLSKCLCLFPRLASCSYTDP